MISIKLKSVLNDFYPHKTLGITEQITGQIQQIAFGRKIVCKGINKKIKHQDKDNNHREMH